MEFELDEINIDDWIDIREIYEEGIASGNSTFETEPPSSFEEWMEGKNGTYTVIPLIRSR
jgi:L-amino acid N-acyltransferase YncA